MAASPAFARADPEAILAELRACYPAQLREDIETMRRALEKARALPAERRRHIARVFEIAHATKGQTGTFGFPLVTAVADRLCVFMRRAARGSRGGEEAVLWRYLDALVLLAHHDIRGEVGALGQRLLADLDELTACHRASPSPPPGARERTRHVPENESSGE